jgi:hypothetical protein
MTRDNVVNGANGNVALLPSDFDVKSVVNAGTADHALEVALLVVSPGAKALADAATASDLAKFRRGGEWDLQRLSGEFDPRYVDSATILIGMFAASAHISRGEILSIENLVARGGKYAAGTAMDPTYTHLPQWNVTNTDIGIRLVTSGAISGN